MVDQLCSYRIVVDLRMPGFVVSTSSSCCSVPHGQVSSFWWWWWWYWSSNGIVFVCPSKLIFCMEQSTFSPGHVHWANGRHRTFISSWRPGCSCRHSPCISSGMAVTCSKQAWLKQWTRLKKHSSSIYIPVPQNSLLELPWFTFFGDQKNRSKFRWLTGFCIDFAIFCSVDDLVETF